jgi:hypothetical protein
MIDKATFRRIKPNWSGMGIPKDSSSVDPDEEDYSDDENEPSDNTHPIHQKTQREILKLADDDYVLATPIVYGFALGDKQWVEFNIDNVQDIVWNDTAFGNLVLPSEKKSLIQALVEAHSQKGRAGFDDFIVGKGQGLVIK